MITDSSSPEGKGRKSSNSWLIYGDGEYHVEVSFLFGSSSSGAMYPSQASPPKHTQVKYIEEPAEPRFSSGGVVAHAIIDEPITIGHEQGERYGNTAALTAYRSDFDTCML